MWEKDGENGRKLKKMKSIDCNPFISQALIIHFINVQRLRLHVSRARDINSARLPVVKLVGVSKGCAREHR